MSNVKPQLTAAYEVYLDGYRLVGTVEAELPNPQAVTVEIKGSGMGGPMDVPVQGQTQNMSIKLTWNIATKDAYKLLAEEYQHIELWASTQNINTGTGKYEQKQQKVIVKGIPVGFNLGKFAQGEVQGQENSLNISYLKWIYDGIEICEIDIFNMKKVINGNDMLANVRAAIGL